jgi:DNA-binding transcriptional MerR regulator
MAKLRRGTSATGFMTHGTEIRAAAVAASFEDTPQNQTGGARGSEADPAMTIGAVASEFGLTARALRFYEAKRLIAPRRQGTSRLYRRRDRERIALILAGRQLGFTLAEIKELLDRPQGKTLHLTRDKCVEQINHLERQKRGIDLALCELRRIYTSFYRAMLDD